MFDESYDNYIRSILGYPIQNTMNYYGYQDNDYSSTYRQTNNSKELEECYPEIYKIIYPMVTKTCNSIQEPITRDMIERLTDKIYFAIEDNNDINVNINLTNEVRSGVSNSSKPENRQENKQETSKQLNRQRPINRNLRDLIKILILREFLNRPGMRPPRPPFPGPGPGPRPPIRPPIMPRYNEDSYNFYEN